MSFLALWNDFARGREAEYEEWHMREHLPERVAAPGFRSGRRYIDWSHPAHRWFTLYEVDDAAAFATPEYSDLLANPTPWSAAMRPDFRHFLRLPCEEVASAGFGIGAALAVLRLDGAAPDLAELVTMPGVVRARLGVPAEGLPAHAIGAASAAEPVSAVLLIEAQELPQARAAFARCGGTEARGGVYALAFLFPGFAPGERAAHRRARWSAPA